MRRKKFSIDDVIVYVENPNETADRLLTLSFAGFLVQNLGIKIYQISVLQQTDSKINLKGLSYTIA